MKFTGTIITAASGKLNGSVASHNRFGPYMRAFVVPVNPSSSRQQTLRNLFAQMVTAWFGLTAAQRAAWATYAANVSKVDSGGRTYYATGQNWFVGLNVIRVQNGLLVLAAAPTVFAEATMTPPVPTAGTLTSSHAFTNTDAWATAVGGALSIYQSLPQNPTVNFYVGPYRLAGTVLGAATPPTSPQVKTNPVAGVSGQRFHFLYRAILADGRISAPFRTSAVVP